ncbi:MAG: hypothetical protein NC918_08055 [Candidatus Omnitrophica bacterium]|nr:hypothetical protein [Candidatus Omnitrophota bacterium]
MKLKNSIPSTSVFALYLGINKNLNKELDDCYEIYYVPKYEEDNPWDVKRINKKSIYANLYCYLISFQDPNLAPPDNESIQ